MTASTVRQITFEEFEQMPDHPGKLELLRGELIDLPPAKRKHNEIAERITFELLHLVERARAGSTAQHLGKVHHEMGYLFERHSWLKPDVSITHKDQGGDDYYLGAPALAVEVVSESNTAAQMDAKIAEYLAGGALEVWVVYPKKEHLWVYRPDGTAEMHSGEFASQILAGAKIDVARFLAD
jgi:Uma2 family endonuclease